MGGQLRIGLHGLESGQVQRSAQQGRAAFGDMLAGAAEGARGWLDAM
jgi:hypothetical protein